MKYWGYLAAKLALVAGIVYGLQITILNVFPKPVSRFVHIPGLVLYDLPITFGVMASLLVGAGLFALAIRDQRGRCRTCLRRLIMPVPSGSWGNMLRLGRPPIL